LGDSSPNRSILQKDERTKVCWPFQGKLSRSIENCQLQGELKYVYPNDSMKHMLTWFHLGSKVISRRSQNRAKMISEHMPKNMLRLFHMGVSKSWVGRAKIMLTWFHLRPSHTYEGSKLILRFSIFRLMRVIFPIFFPYIPLLSCSFQMFKGSCEFNGYFNQGCHLTKEKLWRNESGLEHANLMSKVMNGMLIGQTKWSFNRPH